MSAIVRYLHHPASQPCRAVHQFLLEIDVPFEEEIVDIMSGVNETQQFKDRYNPTGQVPDGCPASAQSRSASAQPPWPNGE